jgi:hypothetical protein
MSVLDDKFDFFRSVITEVGIARVVFLRIPASRRIVFATGQLTELRLTDSHVRVQSFFRDTAVASKVRLTRTDSRHDMPDDRTER